VNALKFGAFTRRHNVARTDVSLKQPVKHIFPILFLTRRHLASLFPVVDVVVVVVVVFSSTPAEAPKENNIIHK
jgi:hypothetical protein